MTTAILDVASPEGWIDGATVGFASAAGKFRALADWWIRDHDGGSSTTDVRHPAYLQIIGMGREAIPFLLDELVRETGRWFVALKMITGASPVPPEARGDYGAMRDAWLAWGNAHGYRPLESR